MTLTGERKLQELVNRFVQNPDCFSLARKKIDKFNKIHYSYLRDKESCLLAVNMHLPVWQEMVEADLPFQLR